MKTALFLGIPLEGTLANQLASVPPDLRSLFIRDESSYLQIIDHEGKEYIGKSVDASTTLAQLDQLELNISTLLTKLIPSYTHEEGSLFLLPRSES